MVKYAGEVKEQQSRDIIFAHEGKKEKYTYGECHVYSFAVSKLSTASICYVLDSRSPGYCFFC